MFFIPVTYIIAAIHTVMTGMVILRKSIVRKAWMNLSGMNVSSTSTTTTPTLTHRRDCRTNRMVTTKFHMAGNPLK